MRLWVYYRHLVLVWFFLNTNYNTNTYRHIVCRWLRYRYYLVTILLRFGSEIFCKVLIDNLLAFPEFDIRVAPRAGRAFPHKVLAMRLEPAQVPKLPAIDFVAPHDVGISQVVHDLRALVIGFDLGALH